MGTYNVHTGLSLFATRIYNHIAAKHGERENMKRRVEIIANQ